MPMLVEFELVTRATVRACQAGEPECGGADSYSCLLALRLNGLPHSALTYNDRPLFDTSGFSRDGAFPMRRSRLKPRLRKHAMRGVRAARNAATEVS